MDMDRIKARYRKLVFFTWFLTLDLIMFGAFVRLTDSGLGCPDWPGCYGKATPLGAMGDIHEATQAMPFGPVTLSKAWIEMIHRYVGAILGMLIIAIVVMAWRYRRQLGRSPALAIVTLVAVCVQGAFGAWTVTHKLMPAVVTAHLVFGLSVLALMTWLSARERPHLACPPPPRALGRGRLRAAAGAGHAGRLGQHQLRGAGLHGLSHVPWPVGARDGFPRRLFSDPGLGELPSGEMISQPALTAIHWVHRNFAFVVFAYLGVLAWRLRAEAGLRGPATLMLALLGAQLLTGLTTIFFQWPLLIAVLHNGGAAGLTLAAVVLMVRLSTAGRAPAGLRPHSARV